PTCPRADARRTRARGGRRCPVRPSARGHARAPARSSAPPSSVPAQGETTDVRPDQVVHGFLLAMKTYERCAHMLVRSSNAWTLMHNTVLATPMGPGPRRDGPAPCVKDGQGPGGPGRGRAGGARRAESSEGFTSAAERWHHGCTP